MTGGVATHSVCPAAAHAFSSPSQSASRSREVRAVGSGWLARTVPS